MAAKKKIDPVKQREKRAKMFAIGGVVLLLGIGAIEVPKMMALMNKKPLTPGVATPAATTGALPNIATGATTGATAASTGQLVDTDLPPAPSADGQLVSFDVFETKNPFRPQVSDAGPPASAATPAAATPAAGSGSGSAATTPSASGASSSGAASPSVSVLPSTAAPATTTTPSTPASVIPPTAGASASPLPPTTTTATAPSVSISVNGVVSRVGRDGTFPSGKPVFRLVSWVKGSAQIGIVGGSYSTGDPTLTLKVGKSVTLQNTSDAQRYKLVLLSTP